MKSTRLTHRSVQMLLKFIDHNYGMDEIIAFTKMNVDVNEPTNTGEYIRMLDHVTTIIRQRKHITHYDDMPEYAKIATIEREAYIYAQEQDTHEQRRLEMERIRLSANKPFLGR
ncbi:hypothetical protein THIOSC15_2930026 [uncultured Thiomicrorhabdus sp.]